MKIKLCRLCLSAIAAVSVSVLAFADGGPNASKAVGDVFLNGEKIASTEYGYLGCWADLTAKLNWEGDNVLAVRADWHAGLLQGLGERRANRGGVGSIGSFSVVEALRFAHFFGTVDISFAHSTAVPESKRTFQK